MLSKFTCAEINTHIDIQDYEPPDVGTNSRYPALIDDNQMVVLQMSGVDDIENKDLNLSMVTLCPGVLETEILPLLSQTDMTTFNICSMFYIENVNHNIVYRSTKKTGNQYRNYIYLSFSGVGVVLCFYP